MYWGFSCNRLSVSGNGFLKIQEGTREGGPGGELLRIHGLEVDVLVDRIEQFSGILGSGTVMFDFGFQQLAKRSEFESIRFPGDGQFKCPFDLCFGIFAFDF